jgi:hypothetical protein
MGHPSSGPLRYIYIYIHIYKYIYIYIYVYVYIYIYIYICMYISITYIYIYTSADYDGVVKIWDTRAVVPLGINSHIYKSVHI